MLLIPLNEGKVFLNVPLFKQAQLCLFIHLYTQDWFVAHMLSQKNKTGESHSLSGSKGNEEMISSLPIASIWRGALVPVKIFYHSFDIQSLTPSSFPRGNDSANVELCARRVETVPRAGDDTEKCVSTGQHQHLAHAARRDYRFLRREQRAVALLRLALFDTLASAGQKGQQEQSTIDARPHLTI